MLDQCQTLEDALTTALWDEKKCLVEDVRLDDGTSDIDTLDAFEYTFERGHKPVHPVRIEVRR